MNPGQRRAMQLKQRARAQVNLTLVYGPPCGGKTTHVQAVAEPGDAVIDYDLIAQDLGATSAHGHADIHDTVMAELNRRLDASRSAPHAWLVKCEPTRSDMSRATRHVLIDPGMDVCLKRAEHERPDGWDALICEWYARRA